MKIIILLIFKFIFLNHTSLFGSDYSHGIAMHGDLKYKQDFKKFEYANANAFKGGKIKLSSYMKTRNFYQSLAKFTSDHKQKLNKRLF